MKKLVFLSLLFIAFTSAKAQQDAMFSQYMFNDLYNTPGFAGSGNKIDATLISRQQWVGFDGAPQTNLFTIQSPIDLFGKKHGVGLTLLQDKLGPDKDFRANLVYAYHLDLWGGDLGLGTNFGIYNKSLNGGDLKGTDTNDSSIPKSEESNMAFDLSLGAYYKNDKLYAGLSVSHILNPKIKQSSGSAITLDRHVFLTGGYEIPLSNPAFELNPSVMIKTDFASYQATVNAKVTYNKKFWGGAGYRYQDAFIFMAGVELANNVRVGYAYDLNISKLKAYNGGSHEIMLNYSFTISTERIPQKYKSVRFL